MQINLKALKAVAMFASKEESRYYLCGVNVRSNHDCVFMEATNGHYFAIIKEDVGETVNLPESTIIPTSLINKIKLDRKMTDYAELTVEGDSVSIRYAGSVYTQNKVDGTYPDTKRIVPETVSNETAQFNSDYPALFGKAAKLMGREVISIAHNGQSPALVDWLPEDSKLQGFGVLMPMRTNSPMQVSPSWARYDQSNAA